MLRFNCYFTLALIVLTITMTTAREKDSCNVIEETAKVTCKALKSLYPQDDGQLGTALCSCITSFQKSDPSDCNPDKYDFPAVPLCGKLFKSKDFVNACKNSDNLLFELQPIMFRDVFHVCTEKDEKKLIKSTRRIFQPGFMSDFFVFLFENAFPADVSKQFIDCHKQLEAASSKQSED